MTARRTPNRGILYIYAVFILLLAGPGAAAIKLDISGVEDDEKKNVLLFLSVEQYKDQANLSEGRVRALHARAPSEIRAALKPFGWYRPQIESTLTRDNDDWQAHYRIDPGPRLTVTSLDIKLAGEADGDPAFRNLLDNFPLKPGGPLIHARYESGKRALLNLSVERGYFDARLTRNELRIDLNAYTADVIINYDSGPRFQFGAVQIEQDIELDLDLLRRMVPFKPGDPFDTAQVLKLQSALSDSGYFQQVDVQPRRDLASERQVPVELRLTGRTPNKYTLGVGFGTDTGVRGKLGWERRLINRSGHRFGTELNASEIRTGINARYTIPVGDPLTDQVALNVGYVDDHPETSDSQTYTVGASYSHARGRWRETIALNYEREDFQVANESGRSNLLVPGVNWLRVDSDDRLYARHGWRLQLDLRGTAESIGSDVAFLQGRANGKYIYPLSEPARLIARLDLGATAVSRFEELPASYRFFAGGDLSVRGYDYNTIGSVNSSNEIVGGKYLAVGSLEYERRLRGKWSAALFYDVGNAFNDLSTEFYKHGVGLGVRWRSPIGPVRLDYANAVSEDGHPWRVHIVIGPDL